MAGTATVIHFWCRRGKSFDKNDRHGNESPRCYPCDDAATIRLSCCTLFLPELRSDEKLRGRLPTEAPIQQQQFRQLVDRRLPLSFIFTPRRDEDRYLLSVAGRMRAARRNRVIGKHGV